jgi:SAM-dependent methyltransferase
MGSVSFDRIADSYDETRGGLERGGNLAREIAPLLRHGAVVEIGVGTGAVALPLHRLGHPVAGLDLSLPMLRRSRDRLGACVAQGDGYRLPLRTAATPNVVIVWVLQLVPDLAGFLAEARRVLAPGGRLAVLPAGGQYADDDIDAILRPMHHALRPPRDQPPQVVAAAEAVGLALAEQAAVRGDVWRHSPEEQAERIEARAWSSLWDVPDDRWAAVVEPALAALRALPDPDRQRQRRTHHDILAFEHA